MARTLAERIAHYESIRDNYEDILLQMSTDPKVSYNVDGQQFDFNGYQEFLLKAIAKLDAQIAKLDTRSGGGMTQSQIIAG